MVKTHYTDAWIDRYLRDELTAEDEMRFETALLESPELQSDLEAALAVRRALEIEMQADRAAPPVETPAVEGQTPWIPMALTGSLVVVVLSGVMYWNVSHEMADLRNGMQALERPHSHEVLVPLDIMRSASTDIPEAVIYKPTGGEFIALDIELTAIAREAGHLRMALRSPEGLEVATWHASASANGRVRSSFDPEFLPEGQVWLEVQDSEGTMLDRRLLEFR
ncbi:hypothetical protein [Elongatibacter sediminis]|uniref:Zinc-finger domain-containing protein n=1 Tax=Elongatibacter sediminis TaxID=3119006 RepID=A0AAW9RCF1_9GAMM